MPLSDGYNLFGLALRKGNLDACQCILPYVRQTKMLENDFQ